ncbi:rhodanese-related sulfurtransferase [Pseudokineococcus lusitanus]|uniref:Rhodanese-related sulfurtransferase n=1 Tax=Pseudokineococcus lusitanus TaxID=763993 RepID=A0A3N1HTB4_9ACTN|nr:rhodanese-like domain-containing protein [Pseudokineococcus lusitanus]ROP45764.1 rhodanese-related sulfurtransferase [Pseudokineococcus lusitanus]
MSAPDGTAPDAAGRGEVAPEASPHAAPAGAAGRPPADGSYAGDLTPTEAWELLGADERAVLVDVRTDAEWAYVGVPDPSSVGRPLLTVEWQHFPTGERNPSFLAELVDAGVAEGAPLVFLCRSGVRSVGAAQAATTAGLGPAYNVLDGFEGPTDEAGHRGSRGWRADGLPWRQG